MRRRTLLKSVLATVATMGALGALKGLAVKPSYAAEGKRRWRMVTSWSEGAPGTGRTAERLARRIEALSQRELTIEVYAAGKLVGPFEVFDAVGRGVAEMGHSASFFWSGKTPLSAFWTTVPFGLNPTQHYAWLYEGGGQELWDQLYGEFGLRAFAAGNSGPSMGGWFKKPLTSRGFRGLKMRMPGLAGRVVKELGALPISVAPAEIFQSLQSGALDSAEFLAPWQDYAYGLHKAASYYYYPGFHEPNGSAECLINRKAYASLPTHIKEAIITACQAENVRGLSESHWYNAVSLEQLTNTQGVALRAYDPRLLKQLKEASEQVLAEVGSGSDLARRIYQSYRRAQHLTTRWSSLHKLDNE